MDKRQRIVVWIALALIAVMGLWPPWVESYQRGTVHVGPTSGGYYWVFSQPEPPSLYGNYRYTVFLSRHIDFARLFLQWAMVVVVAAGLMLALNRRAP
jgi:hypothetical protein